MEIEKTDGGKRDIERNTPKNTLTNFVSKEGNNKGYIIQRREGNSETETRGNLPRDTKKKWEQRKSETHLELIN